MRTERQIMKSRESGIGPIGSLLLLAVLTVVPVLMLFLFGEQMRYIAERVAYLLTR